MICMKAMLYPMCVKGKVSFVFIERWKTEEDLKKHVAMSYHDDFLDILSGKLETINVQRLTKL